MLKARFIQRSALILCCAAFWGFQPAAARAELDLVDPPAERHLREQVERVVTQYKVLDIYPDKSFQGERAFTRYELADALARGSQYLEQKYQLKIQVDYRMASYLQAYFAPSGDIPRRHWARPQIERSMALGFISGDQNLSFHGLQRVTRYQLAQALWGVYQWLQISSLSVNESRLRDLDREHWAAESVEKLVQAGILYPDLDGRFHGDRQVKRVELADALGRALAQIEFIAQQQGGLKPRAVQPLPPIFIQPRYDGRRPPFNSSGTPPQK